eukprot:3303671-Karenia_brevis.AAC.1
MVASRLPSAVHPFIINLHIEHNSSIYTIAVHPFIIDLHIEHNSNQSTDGLFRPKLHTTFFNPKSMHTIAVHPFFDLHIEHNPTNHTLL